VCKDQASPETLTTCAVPPVRASFPLSFYPQLQAGGRQQDWKAAQLLSVFSNF